MALARDAAEVIVHGDAGISLTTLGVEFTQASLGNRSENVNEAILCLLTGNTILITGGGSDIAAAQQMTTF